MKLWECPKVPWLSWPWFAALGAAETTGGDGGVGRRGGIVRRKEGGGCTGRAAAVAGGVDTGETLPDKLPRGSGGMVMLVVMPDRCETHSLNVWSIFVVSFGKVIKEH